MLSRTFGFYALKDVFFYLKIICLFKLSTLSVHDEGIVARQGLKVL